MQLLAADPEIPIIKEGIAVVWFLLVQTEFVFWTLICYLYADVSS
jgi:hypothetical protein